MIPHAQHQSSLQTAASRGLLILPGQEQNFLQMESDLLGSLKPDSGFQSLLFGDVLRCYWNLHRCQVAEAQLYSGQTDLTRDPLLDDAYDKPYKRIRQFERSNRLALEKALNRLSSVQTEVRYRLQAFPPQQETAAADQMPHKLSVLCNTAKVLTGALKTGKTAIPRMALLASLLGKLIPPSNQQSAAAPPAGSPDLSTAAPAQF